MSDNYVLEVAIFRVKPEAQANIKELRLDLRRALEDFPGLIEYRAFEPVNNEAASHFADLAKWRDYTSAAAAARAFEQGDPRFLPYMQAIEAIEYMGHFTQESPSD